MKMFLVLAAALMTLFAGSESFAFKPAVIGGVRDGAALGILFERPSTKKAAIRFGIEANTGNTPIIVFVGGKWFLTNLSGSYPMSLSGGLAGYLGSNHSDAGPYISLVFDRLLDFTPLFLEVGIDVVGSGRLQLQAGYYF